MQYDRRRVHTWYCLVHFPNVTLSVAEDCCSASSCRQTIMLNSLQWRFERWSNPLLKSLLYLHCTLPSIKQLCDTVMCRVKKFLLFFVLNLLPDHVTAPRQIRNSEQTFSLHFCCSAADCGALCYVSPQSYLLQSKLLLCIVISSCGIHNMLLSLSAIFNCIIVLWWHSQNGFQYSMNICSRDLYNGIMVLFFLYSFACYSPNAFLAIVEYWIISR